MRHHTRIRKLCIPDGQPRLSFTSWFCMNRDFTRIPIVDHAVIVIPEDVLGRFWTLQDNTSKLVLY